MINDYLIVGDCDSKIMMRISDIAYIDIDTLNPNDINYYIVLKYKEGDELKRISIDHTTYEHIINKIMPEYLALHYPLCSKCGGYPISFSSPDENKQGVVCSNDREHEVYCAFNKRHSRAPLFEAWVDGTFGDISNLCD